MGLEYSRPWEERGKCDWRLGSSSGLIHYYFYNHFLFTQPVRKFAVEETAAQTYEVIFLDHIAQKEVEFLRSYVSPSMHFSAKYQTQVSGDYSLKSNEKPFEDFKLSCNMIRFAFRKDLSGNSAENELNEKTN